MFGAMIGDIVGSRWEFRRIKTKAFPLFSDMNVITDDSILTVAVADARQSGRAPGRFVGCRTEDGAGSHCGDA